MPPFLENIIYLIKTLTFRDGLDIFLVFIFVFFILYFIVENRLWTIIFLFCIAFFAYYLSKIFNLAVFQYLIRYLLSFGILIVVIIFQKEIRRFILNLKFLPLRVSRMKEKTVINEIMETLNHLSKNKIGAIIVFKGKEKLRHLIHGGLPLNSEINSKILVSIFQKTSPLHDGAVIIDRDKILLAAVHLPLAESISLPKSGTRHRAALGITEESDAFSIVVSEETGEISFCERKKMISGVEASFVEKKLDDYYIGPEGKRSLFSRFLHLRSLALALIFSIALSFSIWVANNYNRAMVQRSIEMPIEFRNLDENLMISKTSGFKVNVTILGNEIDFKYLNTEDKKAIIDLKNYKKGSHTLRIEKGNLDLPSNFEILKIEPQTLQIQIIERPTSSSFSPL